MSTDLALHIRETRAVDTHEHMKKESEWVQGGPGDVLADLFSNYVRADLISAGADAEAVKQLTDSSNPDVEGRFAGVAGTWKAIEFTGYGQAVRLMAKDLYGLPEITPAALRDAQPKLDQLRQPGQRLHLLRDLANLDHIQTDDFVAKCEADLSGPEFFLNDLSWFAFCSGHVDPEPMAAETGIMVRNLATLHQVMQALFHRYAPYAIAVKSLHAYVRTLRWTERSDADAERALAAVLKKTDHADKADRECLGDWCLARGVELAIEYNLPFKIHTGYYAGNNHMAIDRIRAGHLCPLLMKYPEARFVLMHIAYPYSHELMALVKHYSNAYADLCWAWSLNPYASAQFVRQFIHTAPINKLFAFGGDTSWPTSAYAYALQMRHYLTRALQKEVDQAELTETQAMGIATKVLRDNQLECFDIGGCRAALRSAVSGTHQTCHASGKRERVKIPE